MTHHLSDIQCALLNTFKAFASFCEQHDIQYFAAYGTMLGAIRHQGFIPWDDDMDVFMTRDQYEKFLALKPQLQSSTHYDVADYRDKGYPYDFAKFYDTSRTFWELPQFPYILGPFIDIFPLDVWDVDSPECSELYDDLYEAFWYYRKSIAYHPWSEILDDARRLSLLDCGVKLAKKLYYAPQYRRYLRRIQRIEQRMGQVQGAYYKDYAEAKKRAYRREWFDSAVSVPFEDTTIIVPAAYDQCLTADYGDYMTPPEAQERSGHHQFYYLNLDRRVSRCEILAEKAKERKPRKRLSLKVLINELTHRRGF